MAGIAVVGDLEGRGPGREAPAPFMHLLLADLLALLVLVLSLKGTVVPLVQSPVPLHPHPQKIKLVEHGPERPDRAFLDGGEAEIERYAFGFYQPCRPPGLFDAMIGQIDIRPSGETVVAIPDAMSMAKKNEGRHRGASFSILNARRKARAAVFALQRPNPGSSSCRAMKPDRRSRRWPSR